MVQYSNGQLMCFGPIPDQHIRKQDDVHLSSIQMVVQLGIQRAFQTIWHPTSFRPFKYRYSNHLNTKHLNTGLFSVQYSNGST